MTSDQTTATTEDPRFEPLRAALRRGAVRAVVVCLAGGAALAVAGWAVDGGPGLLGAAVGAVTALSFLLVTSVVALATVGRDPLVLASAILGSWLVKAVVAIAVLVSVRGWDAVEPVWVGVGIIVGLVLTLWSQAQALLTARIPYVDGPSRDSATGTGPSST